MQVWVNGQESGISADEFRSERVNVRQWVLGEIIQTTRLWTLNYYQQSRNLQVHSVLKTMTENADWAERPMKS